MYLSKLKLEKNLIKGFKRSHGRLNGKIIVKHRGTGHKRRYRNINFNENLLNKGLIVNIEYDPNRTSFIAKVLKKEGNKYVYDYILAKNKTNVLQILDETLKNKGPNQQQNLGHNFMLKKFSYWRFNL
jgi:ribosomal protein L2